MSRKSAEKSPPFATERTNDEAVTVFDDIEQGSPEWFALRLGLPTASRFATIMANGKGGGESITRRKLLFQLAGERLTGEPAETFRNDAMERGSAMEDEARDAYARRNLSEIKRVAFVKRTIRLRNNLGQDLTVGCSPDSFVGDDGALEIKTMRPDLIIDLAMKGAAGFPVEHRAQIQGTLWVTGRAWMDLFIFYRGMPVSPTFRIARDEIYIRTIVEEVERFEWELRLIVSKILAMGKG